MTKSRNQNGSGDKDELSYTDVGAGSVVFLLSSGAKALADRLAENFRVVTLRTSAFDGGKNPPELIRRTADQLAIEKYSLVAGPEFASAAIAHAIESSETVESLILIAPKDGSNSTALDLPLEQVSAPTLILFGTRDRVVAPEAGRVYARRIPKCFYIFVYDAGHDIAADRPQALLAVVRDFLEHRERFVIPHESSAVNP